MVKVGTKLIYKGETYRGMTFDNEYTVCRIGKEEFIITGDDKLRYGYKYDNLNYLFIYKREISLKQLLDI